MTRVLIVGATGMLGHKLTEVLSASRQLEVHVTVRDETPPLLDGGVSAHPGVDLSRGSGILAAVLAEVAPDYVINAVGAIKQKDLRADVDGTFYLNATLPHLLALLNPNPEGRVVHISTDCVFTGSRGAYRESDQPDALDVYGRSKACGELEYGAHLTLRTSIVGFERRGHLGLLSWFFSQRRGRQIPGYTRAIFSGLPTCTLAQVIRGLVETRSPLSGLYHVASQPISKFDLLSLVNERFGLGHVLVPDDSVRIDRSLDDSRFRSATHTTRPDWPSLVEELAVDYETSNYAPIYAEQALAENVSRAPAAQRS